MQSLTLPSIQSVLRQHHYMADIQSETQQVYTVLRVPPQEYPLFIKICDDGHLVQLLAFIPSNLEPNRRFLLGREDGEGNPSRATTQPFVPDLARLLHLLNKEIDLPGFGMDELSGIIFYRLMLPTSKGRLDTDLFLMFVKSIEQVCRLFAPAVTAMTSGQMTLEEVLAHAHGLNRDDSKQDGT